MFLKINQKTLIYIVSLFYLSFFLALGTHTDNFFNLKNINFLNIINGMRFLSAFILSVFMIIFSIFIFKKEKIFTNLFFLFFICMLVPFFLGERKPNFMEIYLGVLSIGCVSFFSILSYLKIPNIFNKIIILSICYNSFAALTLFISNLEQLNIFDQNYYYFSNINTGFIGTYFPRTTGLSRSFAILSISLLFLYYNQNKYRKLLLFSSIILNIFIWKMQSRGAIVCYLTAFLFFILFMDKINIKFLIKNIFVFIVLPIFISQYILTNKNYNIMKEIFIKKNSVTSDQPHTDGLNNNKNNKNELEKYIYNEFIKKYNQSGDIRFINKFPIVKDNTGSGRVYLWKTALNKFNQKIFGHGIQADRFLLPAASGYGSNVSNGFIYALISGGYASLLILIFFTSVFLFRIFKLLIIDKINLKKINKYHFFSIIIIIFFLTRSLIENSFTIFSADLLIIAPCFFLLIEKYEKKKIKN